MKPEIEKELEKVNKRIRAMHLKEARQILRSDEGARLQVKILRDHFKQYRFHLNHDTYQSIFGLKDTMLYNAILEVSGFVPYYDSKKLRMMIKQKRKR